MIIKNGFHAPIVSFCIKFFMWFLTFLAVIMLDKKMKVFQHKEYQNYSKVDSI